MSKVFMLVAVMFLGACAGKAETSSEADSTAVPIVADTVTAKADVDSTVVKPEVDKSASNAK